MRKTIKKIILGRHYLIVDECYVTEVLSVISKYRHCWYNSNLLAGGCGWKTEPSAWYIHFTTTVYDWGKVVRELRLHGFELIVKTEMNELYVVKH